MSIYGSWKNALISSGQTASAEVDIGRDYDFLEIVIPAITQAQIYLQVAEKTGGTFQELGDGSARSESTGGSFTTVFKLLGFQYIKVVSTVSQGADRTFRVRGGRF